MILWLASFPRSGNTLLRQMLKCCFGIHSYSIYNDSSDIAGVPEVCERVGHLSYTGEWRDFRTSAGQSSEMFHIKTHDGPADASRAIYVVRHPLSAARSYMEYLNRIAGSQVDMIDCICGNGSPFPSWGMHLDLWDPLNRPGTLLLKYEDMVLAPEAELARIEEFLGCTRSGGWSNPFDGLKQAMPEFFRKGDPRRVDADDAHRRLSACLYGEWMERLGYADPDRPGDDDQWQGILETVARRYHAEVQRLHDDVNTRAENAQECRRWAENAERRFLDQKKIALECMERLRIAEAAPTFRASDGETP